MASVAKRKRDLTKFYAVRAGHKRGVFTTWDECKVQTAGYSGAVYKAFTSLQDAEAFVLGKNPKREDEPVKFYAVAVGVRPGIYTDWPSTQSAIKGAKGPKYKKFETRAECVQFIREKGNLAAYQAVGLTQTVGQEDDDEEVGEDPEAEPPVKKLKTSADKAGSSESPENQIEIWTDGASQGNGTRRAVAGVGVFFGHGDPKNISEPLAGPLQTNQRAELSAILRALEVVPANRNVIIYSDSAYSIQCVTEWFITWRRNNWVTKTGPVKNRDLVEAILDIIEMRESQGSATKFQWVKGHQANAGNVAADRLAVQGCRR